MPALKRELLLCGLLAVSFAALSLAVAAGQFSALDQAVYRQAAAHWQPALRGPALAVAFLGGVELTAVVLLALAAWLWGRGLRDGIPALLAYPLAEVLEFTYKHVITHPGPPFGRSHGDAPSLTSLVETSGGGNSFPSGHMTRSVLVYGLVAFVIWRIGGASWLRRSAVPLAVLLIVLEAVDRLYLGVHWESDVVGGILLGATCLAGAIIWLDRPRPVTSG